MVYEGKAVAYCQGWYDEVSGVGLFEPVGTAAEYRQLGLSPPAASRPRSVPVETPHTRFPSSYWLFPSHPTGPEFSGTETPLC